MRMILLYASYGRTEFYSDFIYKSMKGVGTNDTRLIRALLVWRAPADMTVLKTEFHKKHTKSLKEWVHSETSGKYRDCLLSVIGDT